MQNHPKARQDDIVVQEVFDELVIYDLKRDKVHSLNPTAALVYQHCTGERSIDQLAALLQQRYNLAQPDSLLWLTLNRLEKVHLLEEKVTAANGAHTLTRRQVLKMAGVGIALLPVVATIVAPTAAQASTCKGCGEGICGGDQDCCMGLICDTDNICRVAPGVTTCP